MAFDEVRVPLRVGFGAQGGPMFLTEVVTVEGGGERRNRKWAQARRIYDAATGVVSARDAAALVAFFYARAGRARGFRLQDWSDFSSAPADGKSAPAFNDQRIGVGDGVRTSFQLMKTYSDQAGNVYEREIRKPVQGSVLIGVGGVAWETGWSVESSTGIVTFSLAPASGVEVTAGFFFDVPVRFDTDRLVLFAPDGNLAKTSVPLVEVRV